MALPLSELPTDISELQYTSENIFVPRHIFEDSLVDCDALVPLYEKKDFVVFSLDVKDMILHQRVQSYAANVWFPVVRDIIPTAPGTLVLITSLEMLRDALQKAVKPCFVRLGTMSPKDIRNPPVFCFGAEAYAALLSSERTRETLVGNYLFLREVRTYNWEARCFWSRDALTAVCLPYERDADMEHAILTFFDTYSAHFPYHSAVVDVGFSDAHGLELIEFNTFGPDLCATAGRFNWQEDYFLLLQSKTVVFRGASLII